jgi:hypothetical protein
MSIEQARPHRRRRYRRSEASVYLKDAHDLDCACATLAKLAVIGGGPPMEYVGRWPFYPEDGLDDWATSKTSQRVSSTAQLRLLRQGGAAK